MLSDLAIDEARAAGIKEFIFVTSRGKSALEDYFDHAPELEAALKRAGKLDLLAALKDTTMESGAIAYVRQNRPLGLGHAVWCARRLIGDAPFAVLLPDDVIAAEKPCLQQMIEAYAQTGGTMVAAMEVAPDQTRNYGVLEIDDDMGTLVRARGLVEKPPLGTAPSNLAVIGRYILTPKIMINLNRMKQGAGGEIQLTDAIAAEAATGSVYGYRFTGERYDCGSKPGFLQATVAFALARPELRDAFSDYLQSVMAQQKAAQ